MKLVEYVEILFKIFHLNKHSLYNRCANPLSFRFVENERGFFFLFTSVCANSMWTTKIYGTNDKLRPFTLKLCLKLKSIGQATLFYQPRNGRQCVRLTSWLCFVFILPEFGLKQQQLTFMHAYTLSHTRVMRKNEQERKQKKRETTENRDTNV